MGQQVSQKWLTRAGFLARWRRWSEARRRPGAVRPPASAGPERHLCSRGDGLVLVGVLLLGGGLRCCGLGAKSLWLDEALSWRLLDFPLLEMIARTGDPHTGNPPLYFLLLRLWRTCWGDSEGALRSLAAACGVGTILGMYAFVRALGRCPPAGSGPARLPAGNTAALLAATLVALSPLQIHAAQQVRAYSLDTALTVWSSWLLVRALRPGQQHGTPWVLYGLLALAFCYTHHLALFVVAAQALFVTTYLCWPSQEEGQRRPAAGRGAADTSAAAASPGWSRGAQAQWALLIGLALAAAYLPWLPRLVGQSEEVIRASWQRPLVWQSLAQETWTALVATFANRQPADPWLTWAVVGLLGATLGLLAVRGGWAGWYLFLLGLVPVGLLLVYSLFSGRSLVHARYLTFVQLAWLAGFAMLLAALPLLVRWLVLAHLAFAYLALSLPASWKVIGPSANPGMRGAVAYLLQERTAEEPVVVQTPFSLYKALYYARGRARPVLCAPEPRRDRHPQSAHLTDDDFITPQQLLASGAAGVWCLSSTSYGEPAGLGWLLPEHWERQSQHWFPQDYPWEGPILVEHYRVNPRGGDPAR